MVQQLCEMSYRLCLVSLLRGRWPILRVGERVRLGLLSMLVLGPFGRVLDELVRGISETTAQLYRFNISR
jgi:hypothetical protein